MTKSNIRYTGKGVALLLVVFLVFFLALFVIGFSYLAATDFKIAQNDKFSTMALYVAEAGIERAIYELRQDYTWDTGFDEVVFPAGENSNYTVTVDNSGSPTIILDSTGTVEGTFQRRLQVEVEVSTTSVPYPVGINSWEEE